jgi:iron complex outermembrane recepter protein
VRPRRWSRETTTVVAGTADPCRTGNIVQQPWYNNAQNPNRAQLQALCSALIGNSGSDFNADPNSFNGGGGNLRVEQGNPDLKSESASTWTIGTVFRSPFDHALARNITASIDYYKVEIEDNIGLLAVQDVLDACFNAEGENPTFALDDPAGYCSKIERDPFTGGLARTQTPYTNRGILKTSGMDLGVNWSAAFEDMGVSVPGRISFGTQASRTFHFIQQTAPTSDPQDSVGFSNLPKWRASTRVDYYVGGFSTGISWRFRSKVESGFRLTNPDSPTIGGPSYSRFDANAGYRLGAVDMRMSISNLFNKEPPPYGYNPWATGVGTYLPEADLVGRRYSLSATMNF